MIDKTSILKELKKYKNFNSDVEFAKYLDISTQNLSAWYKRGRFDENKIVDKFPEINHIWILTGEGEMLKENNPKVDNDNLLNNKDSQESKSNNDLINIIINLTEVNAKNAEANLKSAEADLKSAEAETINAEANNRNSKTMEKLIILFDIYYRECILKPEMNVYS